MDRPPHEKEDTADDAVCLPDIDVHDIEERGLIFEGEPEADYAGEVESVDEENADEQPERLFPHPRRERADRRHDQENPLDPFASFRDFQRGILRYDFPVSGDRFLAG